MEILKFLLITVEVVCSVLLVGVILLQKSRSEGLGLAFGSGMGETLFGSRAGNVLTKITITLAVIFLADSAMLGMIFASSHELSIIDQRTAPLPEAPPATAQPGPVGADVAPGGPAPFQPVAAPGDSTPFVAPAPIPVAPAADLPAPAPVEPVTAPAAP
jgi:preprotein translocase subunit SecG